MKKSKRRLQYCTNQIGKGDGVPNFELVRPPENNFFQLEVIQSRSFKQSHAAREITVNTVLPLKCNGKLKFPLCYKCACLENKEMCKCLDSDRKFTHTYCAPELEVAMNMGYSIIQIHEVLHWKETEMYNPVTKEGGLFTKYINTLLKLKQESSGYPQNVTSETEGKNT